jgi:hypothetical protein
VPAPPVPLGLEQTPLLQERPAQHPALQLSPASRHPVQTWFAHVPLQQSVYFAQASPPGLQAGPPLLEDELLVVEL